ncbi:ADP/ATP carrier protein [Podila verticillata]|nr:ADP/ATP carrier protein [Podila verticillata]
MIVGPAFSRSGVAPLERIKLLLQCQDEVIKSGRFSHPYKGIVDCFKDVVADEGVWSLFRGYVTNVVIDIPAQLSKRLVGTMIAGYATEVFTSLFVYPMHYVHTRLANDLMDRSDARQCKGYFDVVLKTLATDGVFGLYPGFATHCGLFVYRGFCFGLLDFSKTKMPEPLQGRFLTTCLLCPPADDDGFG